jgi:hypothetical protein
MGKRICIEQKNNYFAVEQVKGSCFSNSHIAQSSFPLAVI